MAMQATPITEILAMGPVMPVIVINEAKNSVALADALFAGGLKTIEITLRTPAALDSIRAIADARPNICIGAGTIISAKLAHAAKEAGAHFAVSPGTTQAVIDGCEAADLPLLPGASTVSEMMHLLEAGFTTMKFFPASAAGGTSLIRSLTSPLPQIKICPTGGISAISAPEWLALPNVECVGGSWVAPQNLINVGDFAAIEALATEAASLTG